MNEGRYHRNTLLPGWNQERLAQATVVVMGMGALGNVAAQALALAGVKHLILCDMDRIERPNLSRAPLFRESDTGRLKVEAAADALRRLVPDIRPDPRPDRLEHAVGLAELRDADLILGCLDSKTARLELAGRCGLVAAPWIDGATGVWDGEIRPYLDPPQGPCFGCGLDETARSTPDTPRSCRVSAKDAPAGATAPLSFIVGSQMALLAVRHIMGLPTAKDILVLQGNSGQVFLSKQKRDPFCPYHSPLPLARKIPVGNRATVQELLAQLPPEAHPLAWKPFQAAAVCRKCGISEQRIGKPENIDCPSCGIPMGSRTQMDIAMAPKRTELKSLGIAPGEILPVKTGEKTICVELIHEQEDAS